MLETLIHQADQHSDIAIAFLEDGPLVSAAKASGISCKLIQRGRLRNVYQAGRVVLRLREWIRELKPVCTLAWTDFANIYAAPASYGLCPSLWWQQSNPNRDIIGFLSRIFSSSGAIANSEFIRDQLRNQKVKVVDKPLYPPFNSNHFKKLSSCRDSLRAHLGLPKERFIIGNIGRLQAWKGFHNFVDAIGLAAQDYPQILGLIVGARHELEPGYEKELREHVIKSGLEEFIVITGAKTNVADWMATLDVFAHTAEREPFGIVVTEAMAMGLPVIASIPGGPEEVITNGVDGLVVHSNSIEEMAQAIRTLYSSKVLREELGRQAMIRAQAFSSDEFSQRLLNAISGCID